MSNTSYMSGSRFVVTAAELFHVNNNADDWEALPGASGIEDITTYTRPTDPSAAQGIPDWTQVVSINVHPLYNKEMWEEDKGYEN